MDTLYGTASIVETLTCLSLSLPAPPSLVLSDC